MFHDLAYYHGAWFLCNCNGRSTNPHTASQPCLLNQYAIKSPLYIKLIKQDIQNSQIANLMFLSILLCVESDVHRSLVLQERKPYIGNVHANPSPAQPMADLNPNVEKP